MKIVEEMADENIYIKDLEERLKERSDQLEDLHMEAAIDAQLTTLADERNTSTKEAIFDDYTNPNAVANCKSPYVPAKSEGIQGFLEFAKLQKDDVLLDVGCGDGRVCLAAIKQTQCQNAIGLDVSPLCINMAKQLAREEGLENCTQFFQVDATTDMDKLFGNASLKDALLSVTVVFLYTYPTLLYSLTPLLFKLVKDGKVRAIITLTYHLQDTVATPTSIDSKHDLKMYTKIINQV